MALKKTRFFLIKIWNEEKNYFCNIIMFYYYYYWIEKHVESFIHIQQNTYYVVQRNSYNEKNILKQVFYMDLF